MCLDVYRSIAVTQTVCACAGIWITWWVSPWRMHNRSCIIYIITGTVHWGMYRNKTNTFILSHGMITGTTCWRRWRSKTFTGTIMNESCITCISSPSRNVQEKKRYYQRFIVAQWVKALALSCGRSWIWSWPDTKVLDLIPSRHNGELENFFFFLIAWFLFFFPDNSLISFFFFLSDNTQLSRQQRMWQWSLEDRFNSKGWSNCICMCWSL